jgi:conjugative transfer signal peptidase TraF
MRNYRSQWKERNQVQMISGLFRHFARMVIAAVLVAGACVALGVRINVSPSLPTGVYIRGGDLALFCPPQPWGQLAIDRQYRIKSINPFGCADGAMPLLKPIVARAGDVVDVSGNGIAVNGKLIENTAPRRKDSAGRAMTPYPAGRYVVEPGTAWIASSYSPLSFDSRYFGPVEVNRITGYLRPLLVW